MHLRVAFAAELILTQRGGNSLRAPCVNKRLYIPEGKNRKEKIVPPWYGGADVKFREDPHHNDMQCKSTFHKIHGRDPWLQIFSGEGTRRTRRRLRPASGLWSSLSKSLHTPIKKTLPDTSLFLGRKNRGGTERGGESCIFGVKFSRCFPTLLPHTKLSGLVAFCFLSNTKLVFTTAVRNLILLLRFHAVPPFFNG